MPACISRRTKPLARLAVLGGLLAAATFATGGASATNLSLRTIYPTIYVNYGDACVFTVVDDAGNPVTTIAPGMYQIEVNTPEDFASVDQTAATNYLGCDGAINFAVSGPSGQLWTTTLSNGDDQQGIATVTLQPSSTYTLVDNNDPSATTVTFATSASGTPIDPATTDGSGEPPVTQSASSGSSAPLPFRGSLSATVGVHGAVAMTYNGKRVSILKAGRYRVTVVNRSLKNGFILQKLNEPYSMLTRIGVMGTHTMTVTLHAGLWLFYPRFLTKKGWFSVVS